MLVLRHCFTAVAMQYIDFFVKTIFTGNRPHLSFVFCVFADEEDSTTVCVYIKVFRGICFLLYMDLENGQYFMNKLEINVNVKYVFSLYE